MEQHNNQPPKKPEEKRPKGSIWFAIMVSVAAILLISVVWNAVVRSQYTQTTLSDFYEELKNNNLSEVEIRYDRVLYMTKEEAAKPAARQKACCTGLPLNGELADELTKLLLELDAEVDVKIEEDTSFITTILLYVIMFGILFGGMTLLTKRMGGGMMGNIGSSKAKVYVAGKSYGVEVTIPMNIRDDIVWRGQLSTRWFEEGKGRTWPFGDVELTFDVVKYF